ncbi:hypothetical protein M9Y10_044414 [Tritrichomonas musculus]|uniref:Uncharacterized protein n=1 Tax=Tritrichomonas musculus TaxID=1915356 RepID=A0ABR2JTJ3_9EUKA
MRYSSYDRKSYRPQTAKRIKWTEDDDKIFDKNIFQENESKLYELYNYYAKNEIEKHIKYRKEIIYNRPLEQYECVLIDQHIYHGYSLSVAANFLRLRTVTSLKKLVEQRKRYLQMNGYIK